MSSPDRQSKTDVITDFRRNQILEAARESFARQGMAGTTVDGIARRAGVAKGTVYLYYRSKEEILKQVLGQDLAELHEATVPVVSGPGTIEQKLERFVAGAVAFFDRKRDFFEQCQIGMSPEVRKKAQQKFAVVFSAQAEAWRKVLAEAHEAGELGAIDIESSALMIVALANGLARQRLRGWTSGPIEPLAANVAATLLKGLAAR